MTDELIKKAEETVKRNVCGDCNKCQSHGYIGCDVYKYSKDSFIAGAKVMQEENEQLKQLVLHLEDNLRVARKDREDLRDSVANGLAEFIKEKPHTSLVLLANKEIKEENNLLKRKVKNVSEKLSDFLSEYEVGNYDYNIYQFYSDMYDIYDELMEVTE